jgi:hypothetical protein
MNETAWVITLLIAGAILGGVFSYEITLHNAGKDCDSLGAFRVGQQAYECRRKQ